MKTLIATLILIMSISTSFGGVSLAKKNQMSLKLENYFLFHSEAPRCRPIPMSRECVDYVAGSYATGTERADAVRACIGNYGIKCAEYVAGSYATTSERTEAVKACKYVMNTECATFVAGSYASHSERKAAVSACGNAELSCVKYVAGNYATTSEKIAAAQNCSGQDLVE